MTTKIDVLLKIAAIATDTNCKRDAPGSPHWYLPTTSGKIMARTVRFGEDRENRDATPVLISLPHVLSLDGETARLDAEHAAPGDHAQPQREQAAAKTVKSAAAEAARSEALVEPMEIGSTVDLDQEAAAPDKPDSAVDAGRSKPPSGSTFQRPATKAPRGALPKIVMTLILMLLVYLAYTTMMRPSAESLDPADAPLIQIDEGDAFAGPTIEAPGLGDLGDFSGPSANDDVFDTPLNDDPPEFPDLQAPPMDAASNQSDSTPGEATQSAPVAATPPPSMGPDYRYNPYPRTETPTDTVEFLRMSMRTNSNSQSGSANAAPAMAPTPPFGDSGNDSVYR